jgi:hypothetical protein
MVNGRLNQQIAALQIRARGGVGAHSAMVRGDEFVDEKHLD